MAECEFVGRAVEEATPFTHAGRTALQKILAVLREVDAESTCELAARIRLFDEGAAGPGSLVAVERRYCRLRQAPRAFRLDRIRAATVLDERVQDRGLDPSLVELPTLIGRGILGEMRGTAPNE